MTTKPRAPSPATRRKRRRSRRKGTGRLRAVGLGLAGTGGFVLRRITFWAPVWLPVVVLVQFALLGLAPARAEGRRLAQDEARVGARVEALLAERAALHDDGRCLADPIYRERVRKNQRNAGALPLSLEERPLSLEERPLSLEERPLALEERRADTALRSR